MPGEREDLIEYLKQTTLLNSGAVERVVDDVLAFYSETVEQYVVRRHRELLASGLRNAAIYARLTDEVAERRFGANPLTVRQVRRLIYG
ncbi:MAG: hypothetical protein O3A63_21875 [Proteobacteria bacterium]|nr:hypothetical protein [Pseudomonadota bacterium]